MATASSSIATGRKTNGHAVRMEASRCTHGHSTCRRYWRSEGRLGVPVSLALWRQRQCDRQCRSASLRDFHRPAENVLSHTAHLLEVGKGGATLNHELQVLPFLV